MVQAHSNWQLKFRRLRGVILAAWISLLCAGCAVPGRPLQEDAADAVSASVQETNEAGLEQQLLTDDVAFLSQLGLMRGHLWVGMQLYRSGDIAMAKTHMKHPEAELYSVLAPAFSARKVPGFAQEIRMLANRVEQDAPEAEVFSAYDQVLAAISRSETGASSDSAQVAAAVVQTLLAHAADEYAEGVVDHQIAKVHEYQDALGFTQIAQQWARSGAFASHPKLAQRIIVALDGLDPLWPSLSPSGEIATSSAAIEAAADRVTQITLGLSD